MKKDIQGSGLFQQAEEFTRLLLQPGTGLVVDALEVDVATRQVPHFHGVTFTRQQCPLMYKDIQIFCGASVGRARLSLGGGEAR